ncbi:MAG TPA: hypothetical protein VHV78_16765 [Gemmatimonadaceae bacterium]|nr:hypothetical protein [Gemmatimonadaceae bacterium]
MALHGAGYFAIGFGGGVKDLSPFQGQHWIQAARFMGNAPVEIAKPNFMMYLPVGDSLIPIGVAYTERVSAGSALPTDLDGAPAEWHTHIFCRNATGEGNVLADGVEDCKQRGGTPAPMQIAMVHAWTVPNPDGPFAHDNPALPFIATGLKPPAHATQDERLFGVALGESYGAMLVEAHQIDIAARRYGRREQLERHRAVIRSLVPELRDEQRAGQIAKFESTKKTVMDEWTALAAEYRALAQTPEIRARFDMDLGMAIGTMAHHHM